MSAVLNRVVDLQGGCNFRDMGGYVTADGKVVRPGVIFRSGVLSYLTAADREVVTPFGIRTICDLRASAEIEAEPTSWPHDVQMMVWPYDASIASATRDAPWETATTSAEVVEILSAAYCDMSEWLAPHLRGILQSLAAGEGPLLFHCAAGKDRTGVCAAIVLHVLGVDRETIIADYELTNQAVDLLAFSHRHRAAALGLTADPDRLDRMPREAHAALLRADRRYLQTALDFIAERHGSIEAYVMQTLAIPADSLERIRQFALA